MEVRAGPRSRGCAILAREHPLAWQRADPGLLQSEVLWDTVKQLLIFLSK